MTLYGIGVGASGPIGRALVERGLFAVSEHPMLELVSRSDVVVAPGAQTAPGLMFANACVIVQTALAPSALFGALLATESRMGRVRTGVLNAPRPLDLDILWASFGVYDDGILCIPHARLLERAWAKEPLVEAMSRAGIAGAYANTLDADSRELLDFLEDTVEF